jgi:hypothetical protein
MKFKFLAENILNEKFDKSILDEYYYASSEVKFLIDNEEDGLDDLLDTDSAKAEKFAILNRVFGDISTYYYNKIRKGLLLPNSKIQKTNDNVYAKIIISKFEKEKGIDIVAGKIINDFKNDLTYDTHLNQSFWKYKFQNWAKEIKASEPKTPEEPVSTEEEKTETPPTQTDENKKKQIFITTFQNNPLVLSLVLNKNVENKILNVFLVLKS